MAKFYQPSATLSLGHYIFKTICAMRTVSKSQFAITPIDPMSAHWF